MLKEAMLRIKRCARLWNTRANFAILKASTQKDVCWNDSRNLYWNINTL